MSRWMSVEEEIMFEEIYRFTRFVVKLFLLKEREVVCKHREVFEGELRGDHELENLLERVCGGGEE